VGATTRPLAAKDPQPRLHSAPPRPALIQSGAVSLIQTHSLPSPWAWSRSRFDQSENVRRKKGQPSYTANARYRHERMIGLRCTRPTAILRIAADDGGITERLRWVECGRSPTDSGRPIVLNDLPVLRLSTKGSRA
jgi:hypothetical protein